MKHLKHINEVIDRKDIEMTITIKNLASHQYEAFVKMLYAMDVLGSIGSSREIKAFVDGDGSFRSEIIIDGKEPGDLLDKDITNKIKNDLSNDKFSISFE